MNWYQSPVHGPGVGDPSTEILAVIFFGEGGELKGIHWLMHNTFNIFQQMQMFKKIAYSVK